MTINQTSQASTYTGRGCCQCGATQRYTSSRSCVACTTIRRAEFRQHNLEAERGRASARLKAVRQHRKAVDLFDRELLASIEALPVEEEDEL
jgi:hypothetical protein